MGLLKNGLLVLSEKLIVGMAWYAYRVKAKHGANFEAQNHLGGLLIPRSDTEGLGRGLGICIYYKFPGDAIAAGGRKGDTLSVNHCIDQSHKLVNEVWLNDNPLYSLSPI